MKKFVSAACTGLVCLSMAACGSGGGTAGTDSGSESGKKRITLAKENDVISMNTAYATDGMSFEMIAATVDGLEAMDADGNVIPALAESYDLSDDELTYTFHLRDAKWSNGEPVTAQDFVFAWNETVKSPEAEYSYLFTQDGACIKNADEIVYDQKDADLAVKAVDDKTLEVQLSKKCPYFLSLMTFPVFYPINQEFFEEQGDQYALTPDALLACGPYVLTEWTKGQSLKLDKNQDYWDADNVAIDGMDVNIVPEVSTSALDFENGNTDWTKLNSTLVDKYKDNEAYKSVLGSFLWYLQYNFENGDLQNENLRKALTYAVDKENLTQNVLKDGSIPAEGFVTVKLANGPDGKDYRETAEGYFTETGEDSEKLAQEYWEKAKKELGKDEINLRFLFEPSDPAKSAAEFIQSELSKLEGLNIEMVSQEKNVRLKTQQNGDFDVVLTRWGPDYADPTTYLNVLLPGGSFNFGKYPNEEYTAKLKEAADADTDEERWQLLKDAEKIAMDDVAVGPVFQTGASDLLNPKVKHLVDNPVGVPFVYKYVTIEE